MKNFLLLLLSATLLCAGEFEVRYSVSYWFLGRIGTTHLRLETEGDHYRIEATAKLEGIAAMIARHHREHHVSTGKITEDGRLVPRRYDVNKTLDGYEQLRHYYFEPRQRRVLLQEEVKETSYSRTLDMHSMMLVTKKQTRRHSFMRLLPFYAENDLLSLYFNARKPLQALKSADTFSFKAVGARNGDVTVTRLNDKNRFAVVLHQDIFQSKEGKLFVETDDDTYVKSALMKDVLLFGDLEVKREWVKRSP